MIKLKKYFFKKNTIKIATIIGFFILTLELIVVFIGVYKKNPGIREDISLATTEKPQAFTELYFTNHKNLPDFITDNGQYKFSVTIHNQEYKDINYKYEVEINSDNSTNIIERNSVKLQSGDYKIIPEQFSYDFLPNIKYQVAFKLINKNQDISFWIPY